MRKGQQPPWIVSDGLWARIEPLLPVARAVLIMGGIPWEFLPQELGLASATTCWRQLRDWHQAGVWQRLHEALLAELNAAGELDWSRAVIGGSHVRAPKGGPERGRARSIVPCPARSPT